MKILIVAEKPSVALDIAKALLGVKDEGGKLFKGQTPLGDDLTITCAAGHFLQLAKPEAYDAVHGKQFGKWRIADLPILPKPGWDFDEVPRERAERSLEVLCGHMRAHDGCEIVNACDAGREGELIFRKILRHSGVDAAKTTLSRMWMQEMTEKAFRDAYRNRRPLAERDGLGAAGYTRDQADWLSGMNKTVLATKTLPRGTGNWRVWSVGRVQTPTLALIYERDRTIAFFKPQNFWEVYGIFDGVSAKADLDAYAAAENREKLLGRPQILEDRDRKAFWSEALATRFTEAALAPRTYTVKDTSSQRTERPPLPFDLQEASKYYSKKFGWTAAHSLEVLQSLYEDLKVISYPRTDSRYFPDSAEMRQKVCDGIRAAHAWIREKHPATHLATQELRADEEMGKAKAFKNSESDHYALHPLSDLSRLSRANRDQLLAWMAVTQACLIALDEPLKAKVITRRWEQKDAAGDYAPCVFRTVRENVVVPGWTRWVKDNSDGKGPQPMPDLVEEQPLDKTEIKKLETNPPKPFDDATILTAMEYAGATIDESSMTPEHLEELLEVMKDHGLGTPATRAAIIETLVERGFIERKGKALITTQNGRALIRGLKKIDPAAVSAKQTAEMEYELKKMERGASTYTRATFLDALLQQFLNVAEAYKATSTRLGEAERPELVTGTPTAVLCPKSGQPILDRGAAWEAPGFEGTLLWKGCFGRKWTAEDFRALLEAVAAGTPKKYDDLTTRTGQTYSAMLGIDAETKKIVIVEPEAKKLKGIKCPKSGKLMLDREAYFESPGFPGVRFWKNAFGRTWSAEDVVRLIQGVVDKAPVEFTDLVSQRTKKPYAAKLTIDEAAKKVVLLLDRR
jgi:DNA topoisomerase-3